jgi:hypothetical protein
MTISNRLLWLGLLYVFTIGSLFIVIPVIGFVARRVLYLRSTRVEPAADQTWVGSGCVMIIMDVSPVGDVCVKHTGVDKLVVMSYNDWREFVRARRMYRVKI